MNKINVIEFNGNVLIFKEDYAVVLQKYQKFGSKLGPKAETLEEQLTYLKNNLTLETNIDNNTHGWRNIINNAYQADLSNYYAIAIQKCLNEVQLVNYLKL